MLELGRGLPVTWAPLWFWAPVLTRCVIWGKLLHFSEWSNLSSKLELAHFPLLFEELVSILQIIPACCGQGHLDPEQAVKAPSAYLVGLGITGSWSWRSECFAFSNVFASFLLNLEAPFGKQITTWTVCLVHLFSGLWGWTPLEDDQCTPHPSWSSPSQPGTAQEYLLPNSPRFHPFPFSPKTLLSHTLRMTPESGAQPTGLRARARSCRKFGWPYLAAGIQRWEASKSHTWQVPREHHLYSTDGKTEA